MTTFQTILVTGATSGIGKATAQQLLNSNHRVIALDRHPLKAFSPPPPPPEENNNLIAVACDLAQTDQIDKFMCQLIRDYAPITGLVNNAGIVTSNPLVETTDADWDRILAVNLTAPFVLIRSLAPHMKQSGGGAIVNVSSRNAFRSSTGVRLRCFQSSAYGLNAHRCRRIGNR